VTRSKRGSVAIKALKLRKVKRPGPVVYPSTLLAEYSRSGGKHVGKIYSVQRRAQLLFTFRGSEAYVSSMMDGVMRGLEADERGLQVQAYYRGANDNDDHDCARWRIRE
jgi:hypothetical protein